MKYLKTEQIFNSACFGKSEIIFDITKEESDELKNALAIINKYKQVALEKSQLDGDWQTTKFFVNDNSVAVVVECGSCG